MQHGISIKPMVPLEACIIGIGSVPDINACQISGDFASQWLKVLFVHWGVVVQQVLVVLLQRHKQVTHQFQRTEEQVKNRVAQLPRDYQQQKSSQIVTVEFTLD